MTRNPFNHPSVIHAGKSYDLGHLKPFHIVLAGQGRGGRDLIVRIRFGVHVYTDRTGAETDLRIRDENGNTRYFSPRRHGLSLELPDICRRMIREKYPSWISRDRKRRANLAVAGAQPRNGEEAYHIFYVLWPSRRAGIDVEMEIKSAYLRQVSTRGRRENVLLLIKRCHYTGRRQP